MPGRKKLLYLLRQPMTIGHAEQLFPSGSAAPQSDITVVLLERAIAGPPPIPGRTFILGDDSMARDDRGGEKKVISYKELTQFIFDADSTVVI